MFPIIKTNGFVIKKYDFREFDRVYTVYTESSGKISLLARSARKIKSKLAPNLESFNEARLNFIKGKIFNHLIGSSAIAQNSKILKDSEKIQFGYECLGLLDKFIKPEQRDENIYSLIRKILVAINYADNIYFPKINIYFFWKLIDFLGYRPRLDCCALCGKIRDDKEVLFNITDNIIICKKCAGAGIIMKKDSLMVLRKVFSMPLEEFLSENISLELIGITNKARQIKLSEL